MSLQYLKKEVKGEADFLHVDKHESFLKVYFNTLVIKVSYMAYIIPTLMSVVKHFKITQSNKFAISLQYLKKEVRNGGHFGVPINIKVYIKLVLDMFKISKIGSW